MGYRGAKYLGRTIAINQTLEELYLSNLPSIIQMTTFWEGTNLENLVEQGGKKLAKGLASNKKLRILSLGQKEI